MSKVEKSTSGKLVMHISRTAGCKSDPVEFVTVELKGDATTPSLVLLLKSPPRPDGDTPFTKYLRHLGETNACKKAQQPNLLVCVGGHIVGEEKVSSIFLVVTDDKGSVHLQPSKDPTYADCQEVSGSLGCMIVEELGNGV